MGMREWVIKFLVSLVAVVLSVGLLVKFIFSQASTLNSAANLTIGNISNIIMAIVSVINFIFVLIFYFKDKNTRVVELKMNNKTYWFHEIILSNNINKINNFFDSNIDIINNCKELNNNNDTISQKKYGELIKGLFGEYTSEKMKLSNSFISLTSVVYDQLGKTLYEYIEKFQDDFTTNLYNLSIDGSDENYSKCIKLVHSQKKEFLETLYKYDLDIYV